LRGVDVSAAEDFFGLADFDFLFVLPEGEEPVVEGLHFPLIPELEPLPLPHPREEQIVEHIHKYDEGPLGDASKIPTQGAPGFTDELATFMEGLSREA